LYYTASLISSLQLRFFRAKQLILLPLPKCYIYCGGACKIWFVRRVKIG
jgi:hypothetical protein